MYEAEARGDQSYDLPEGTTEGIQMVPGRRCEVAPDTISEAETLLQFISMNMITLASAGPFHSSVLLRQPNWSFT